MDARQTYCDNRFTVYYPLIFLCSLNLHMIFVIVRVAYTTPCMSLFKELGLEREIIKTRWIKETITQFIII